MSTHIVSTTTCGSESPGPFRATIFGSMAEHRSHGGRADRIVVGDDMVKIGAQPVPALSRKVRRTAALVPRPRPAAGVGIESTCARAQPRARCEALASDPAWLRRVSTRFTTYSLELAGSRDTGGNPELKLLVDVNPFEPAWKTASASRTMSFKSQRTGWPPGRRRTGREPVHQHLDGLNFFAIVAVHSLTMR